MFTNAPFQNLSVAVRARIRQKVGRKGRVLMLAIVGGAIALVASEGLRKKVLDSLFGAEEEFEYTSTTASPPSEPSASPAAPEKESSASSS